MAIAQSVNIDTTVSASMSAISLHVLCNVARQWKAWQIPHKCLASWLHWLNFWEVSHASAHHFSLLLAGLHSTTDTAMTAATG